jgi:cation transport ATPase
MALQNIILVYSLLAGIMSILLMTFTIFFEKNGKQNKNDKKHSRALLIWSVLFLASAFAASEYAFWLEGYNLFEFVLGFNFPLVAFFGVWFAFLVWLFESRGERKIWVLLLVVLVVVVLLAVNCMNCINF